MKSTLDILSALYKTIDRENILITGKAYIGDIPKGDQEENISLKCLSNPNEYLQIGYINFNLHIPALKGGRANLSRFKVLIDQIIPIVEDVVFEDYSFQIDDDKGIFEDKEHDNMYFYNLKLIFQTL